MLALSLAFFRVSFVELLPWSSGLVLGSGWVRFIWDLRTQSVPFWVLAQVATLIGFSGFTGRALSGM